MDETSQKVIDATMPPVRDKGYITATTKDIACQASVNECTLFRKSKSKRDIVINGASQGKRRANISEEILQNVQWELQPDLEVFMRTYMKRITPDSVNLSIGLRVPQIYSETAPLTMKIPQASLTAITGYLEEMERRGKIVTGNYESFAMAISSSTFGYTFLKASSQQELTKVGQGEYIRDSVKVFTEGITRR